MKRERLLALFIIITVFSLVGSHFGWFHDHTAVAISK